LPETVNKQQFEAEIHIEPTAKHLYAGHDQGFVGLSMSRLHDWTHLRILCFVITTLSAVLFDGVAKSPPYGVMAFFQDLDIPYVCLRP
jgi:hypothetical protein